MNEAIDFRLGADIDAARGFIEDENLCPGQDRLADDELWPIAAGRHAGRRIELALELKAVGGRAGGLADRRSGNKSRDAALFEADAITTFSAPDMVSTRPWSFRSSGR